MATIIKSGARKFFAGGRIQAISYNNYAVAGMPENRHMSFHVPIDEDHSAIVRLSFDEFRALQTQYERMVKEGLVPQG